ncbi:hypothetical protein GLA29479_2433 [Lysobacter antibioticus]|nr:hypothetical protein GLA29479_2433 [Lysobacter antibioticus]
MSIAAYDGPYPASQSAAKDRGNDRISNHRGAPRTGIAPRRPVAALPPRPPFAHSLPRSPAHFRRGLAASP